MANTTPSLFGASASATLALDADKKIVVVSTKSNDLIGAALAPVVGAFNGGASVGVGTGHTLGVAAMLFGAMFVERKLGLVNVVLPSA